MNRKEFIRNSCGIGLCSCALTSAIVTAATTAKAEDAPPPAPEPPPPAEDWRIGFAKQRYAKLLQVLSERLEPAALAAILEPVGRHCASELPWAGKHAGDPEGLCRALSEIPGSTARLDREAGTVSIAFDGNKKCGCPLAVPGTTPAALCLCSLGWARQLFETAFQRPVQVDLLRSVLRGDAVCALEVRVAPPPA